MRAWRSIRETTINEAATVWEPMAVVGDPVAVLYEKVGAFRWEMVRLCHKGGGQGS